LSGKSQIASPHYLRGLKQADLYALRKVLYEASMGKDRFEFPEPFTGLALNPESKFLMEFNAVLLRTFLSNGFRESPCGTSSTDP
jgi:hypothetical protein